MHTHVNIAVTFTSSELASSATTLAQTLNLPLFTQQAMPYDYLLELTPVRLQLRPTHPNNSRPVYVNFLTGKAGYRRQHGGGLKQTLAKACHISGKHKPSIIDATAGFGQDAFVLASLGADVLMLERSPIIYTLLEDGLKRLYADTVTSKNVQLALQCTDAQDYLTKLSADQYPDVIYLDPMYPHTKKSALVKRHMCILRGLVGPDNDSQQLLPLALTHAKQRVVVKRPLHAPTLTAQSPTIVYRDMKHRYDVYRTVAS